MRGCAETGYLDASTCECVVDEVRQCLNTWTLSLHNFLSYFVNFALLFPFLFLFIKYLKLYIT